MWYFELWCEDHFVMKSDLFHTKDDAILQAEKQIEDEMRKDYESNGKYTNGEYSYELYCTGEEED